MRVAAAVFTVALIGVLLATGQWPELRSKVAFSPKGLVTAAPAEVERVEIRSAGQNIALRRQVGGWSIDGVVGAVPSELAAHLETALRLVHVSEPAREISSGELGVSSYAAFGLDPPTHVAVLQTKDGIAATFNIGSSNPANTSHYVRLGGAPTVYLMPRHVGEEWKITCDMARRLRGDVEAAEAGRGSGLLLPVSMAQVSAVEILFAGKLTRFERDVAGNWFRHVGQHTHAADGAEHVADQSQARIIDLALRTFDATAVEKRVGKADPAQLARYGLNLPSMIVLPYARDSSRPLARVEFGAMSDSLDRYVRLAPDGAVVTVAEFEMRRLVELLKAVGAGT